MGSFSRWVMAAFVLFAMPLAAQAGVNTFSEGCRMGQIIKYSVKGVINKSGEGQMQLGREGAPHQPTGDGAKSLSPWAFSVADAGFREEIKEFVGPYVVVCYEQLQVSSGWTAETDYRVVSVEEVTRQEPDLGGCRIAKPRSFSHDGGVRVGRIVKASHKGTGLKSFEVIVQLGNSGNQYFEMSLSDEKMYDCAMHALRSAKQVNISYVEYGFQLGRDTNYDIYVIEPIDDI